MSKNNRRHSYLFSRRSLSIPKLNSPIPNAKHLTPTVVSYIISPCHEKTKFSTLVIQHRYSRCHHIREITSLLKHTATRNMSSSPSFEAHGDRTVVVSCRQCRRISRLTKHITPHRSRSLDSGPVNSAVMPIKTVSHFRYWWTKHEALSKVTVSITGSALRHTISHVHQPSLLTKQALSNTCISARTNSISSNRQKSLNF